MAPFPPNQRRDVRVPPPPPPPLLQRGGGEVAAVKGAVHLSERSRVRVRRRYYERHAYAFATSMPRLRPFSRDRRAKYDMPRLPKVSPCNMLIEVESGVSHNILRYCVPRARELQVTHRTRLTRDEGSASLLWPRTTTVARASFGMDYYHETDPIPFEKSKDPSHPTLSSKDSEPF